MDHLAFQERVLDNLEHLTSDVTDIKVDLATVKSNYISRVELDEIRRQQTINRRWWVASLIGWVLAAGSFWAAL